MAACLANPNVDWAHRVDLRGCPGRQRRIRCQQRERQWQCLEEDQKHINIHIKYLYIFPLHLHCTYLNAAHSTMPGIYLPLVELHKHAQGHARQGELLAQIVECLLCCYFSSSAFLFYRKIQRHTDKTQLSSANCSVNWHSRGGEGGVEDREVNLPL